MAETLPIIRRNCSSCFHFVGVTLHDLRFDFHFMGSSSKKRGEKKKMVCECWVIDLQGAPFQKLKTEDK